MKRLKSNLFRNFKFEFRITLNYLIFGLLWILFSDKLLDWVETDHSLLTEFQTYKGAFFIFVTTVFLYLLVKKHMQKLRLAESRLIESECHYKALFNNNHSVILLVNPVNAEIEDANPAASEYYGWSHAELCSKSIYDFNTIDKELVNDRLPCSRSSTAESFCCTTSPCQWRNKSCGSILKPHTCWGKKT